MRIADLGLRFCRRLGERLIARVGWFLRIGCGTRLLLSCGAREIERQADDLQGDLAMVVEIESVNRIGVELLFHREMAIPIDGLIQISEHLLWVGRAALLSGGLIGGRLIGRCRVGGRLVSGGLRKQQPGQNQQREQQTGYSRGQHIV